MQLKLNDVKLEVDVERDEVNEDELRELEFRFVAKNETEYHLYKTLIHSKKLTVEIGSEEQGVEFKVKSSSYTLRDEEYEDVPFSLTLIEYQEDDEWNFSTGTAALALETTLKLDAIKEVLIEKEIATLSELQSKLQEVAEKNQDKHINFMTTGKRESAKKEED